MAFTLNGLSRGTRWSHLPTESPNSSPYLNVGTIKHKPGKNLENYEITSLIDDVAQFFTIWGGPKRKSYVGHDFGRVIAWYSPPHAAMVNTLVIFNGPRPRARRRNWR